MSERLWFQSSVEGLFVRGVGSAMTTSLAARLAAIGIDLNALAPAYPAAVMTEAIHMTVAELFPERTSAEGLRELGRVFMRGFGQTFIGAAMVQFMKVIGPRRTLERMQRNFRNGSNFIETRFTAVDERTATLWFNDVSGMPEFYAGILEEGGRTTGTADVAVSFTPGEGADCTFRITWS